jgi:hypothetical protein
MTIPGWTIARAIPHETILGLMMGQYTLHGGVIRWAVGTAKAGAIVQHLIPVAGQALSIMPGVSLASGLAANLQLGALSSKVNDLSNLTQMVLQFSTGTAAIAGLNLIITGIGFGVIDQRLKSIDSLLQNIHKDIQEIKSFLELSERSRLFAALNELRKINPNLSEQNRHTILHSARSTLGEINMRYRELLQNTDTLETAMASEEFFTLTGLAQARCSSELGMYAVAHQEMIELRAVWQLEVRRIMRKILLGQDPERFLATDFVHDVSTAELIQWLDFAHSSQDGLKWIDILRLKFDEYWYSKGWFSGGNEGLNKNRGIGLEKERTILIPGLKKLIHRNGLIEGYVAQYAMLEKQVMSISLFETFIDSIPKSSLTEGWLILEASLPPSKQSENLFIESNMQQYMTNQVSVKRK